MDLQEGEWESLELVAHPEEEKGSYCNHLLMSEHNIVGDLLSTSNSDYCKEDELGDIFEFA